MQLLLMGQSNTGLIFQIYINNDKGSYTAGFVAVVASAASAAAAGTVPAAFFFARLAFFVAAFAAAVVELNMGCSCIEQLMLLEQQ